MSKKGKGRGQKMSLSEFGGGTTADEKNLDWAQDEFAPTPPTGPAQAGDAPPGLDGKKPKRDWRDFGFKAGNLEGNFREQGPVQNANIVPLDMEAPFVAYVGNLPHTIQSDTVEAQFGQVVDVRIVKNDRSTFAYVEFETRDALQNAIILTGKIVGGRNIKVAVATDQQRARLEADRKGGGNAARESAVIGREAMGAAQPRGMGSRMGSRNASAMDLAFSRDTMGQQQQSHDGASPVTGGMPELTREAFGEAKPRTPNSGGSGRNFRDRSKPASPLGGGIPDFAAWRDTERVEQPKPASPADRGAPAFARRKERDGRKTPEEGSAASWRGSAPAKQPEAGTWRDNAQPKPQSTQSGATWRDREPTKTSEAKTADTNSWRDSAPARPPELGNWRDEPAPATNGGDEPAEKDAAPKENPWRRGPPVR